MVEGSGVAAVDPKCTTGWLNTMLTADGVVAKVEVTRGCCLLNAAKTSLVSTLEGPLDDLGHQGLDFLPIELIVQLFNDVLEPGAKA